LKAKRVKDLPIVSTGLVIINVIVFLLCTFTGNLLYNKGMLNISGVLLEREYGRIIWSMFLHSGINHIFNNMVIVFFLGAMLEKEVGHIRYGMVYFLSGIGGNVLSLYWKLLTGTMTGSIGASGAVFGLDGLLLAYILFSGRRLQNVSPVRVLAMIGFSLYGGYTGRNVDNAAHAGGLITGFVIGIILCIADRLKATVQNRWE